MKSRKFPSKTFLLGEYAVLEQGEALLLTSEPFFSATIEKESAPCPFHPHSEAGLYWQKHEKFFREYKIIFQDPHGGIGGFGASGAEFLSLFTARETDNPWYAHRAFKAYAKSSGADILAQLACPEGENALIEINLKEQQVDVLPLPKGGQYFLSVFHTGEKLPTHLASCPKLPMLELNAITQRGITAWKSRDVIHFAKALQDYGNALHSLKLIVPHTLELLAAFQELGALGAKGCGAGGADVVVAVTEKTIPDTWVKAKKISKIFETRI